MGNPSNDGMAYVVNGITYTYDAAADGRWFPYGWPFSNGGGSYEDLIDSLSHNDGIPPVYFKSSVTPMVTESPNGKGSPGLNQANDTSGELDSDTEGAANVRQVVTPTQTSDTDKTSTTGGNTTVSGKDNVSYVVTPNVDSTQDLKSDANAELSIAPVLTTSGNAQSTTSQNIQQGSTGAAVTVAPVLEVNLADTYVNQASSEASPTTTNWGNATTFLVLAAVGVGAFLILRKRKKGGNAHGRSSRKY